MAASVRSRPGPVFHRPLKTGLVAVIAAGVGLASCALIAAVLHHQAGQAWAFLGVAVVLAAVAVAVALGVRWVIVVCFVALAGQAAAIVGTAVELVTGVAAIKQRQLRSLGFDPTAAVAVNLVYSTAGFGLFCWLAWRWKTRRAQRTGRPQEPGQHPDHVP